MNYLLVMALSLYGISKKNFKEDETPYFQVFMIESIGPIQSSTTSFKQSISDLFNNYLAIVNTNKENAQLSKKVLDLENTIFNLQELKLENQRLKDLLSFGQEIPRSKVLAQVVGWDSSTEFNIIRINKGRKQGVTAKSAVVTSEGLVGYVYRVADHYSDIITILDQNNRVDTIVERTRSHGIVQGFSNFSCTMKYVNRNEPIAKGDLVITAGLGEIYPKGIRVGTIIKVERETYGITQMIEVTPSVNFNKLEEVIILIKSDEPTIVAPSEPLPPSLVAMPAQVKVTATPIPAVQKTVVPAKSKTPAPTKTATPTPTPTVKTTAVATPKVNP
jgi:rod shape-determining protein MreC